MFKEFFKRFGPVEGVNIKSRLSFNESPIWEQFLQTQSRRKAISMSLFPKKAYEEAARQFLMAKILTIFPGPLVLWA